MTNALPGKREFWGNLVQGVKAMAILAPRTYMTDENTKTEYLRVKDCEKIEKFCTQMKQVEMQLQVLQQEKNLAFPAEQGELNRQLQGELARLNDFQAEQEELKRQLQEKYTPQKYTYGGYKRDEDEDEYSWEVGILNRQLQEELARLTRDFQANEGKLNRQHALQIELFQENLQQSLIAQQKQF